MDWSKWFLQLLPNLIASVSAPLREQLVTFAKKFKADAAKTENPWDDFLAALICTMLGIDG